MWQRKVSLSKRNHKINQLYGLHCSNIHFLEWEVHTCMGSAHVYGIRVHYKRQRRRPAVDVIKEKTKGEKLRKWLRGYWKHDDEMSSTKSWVIRRREAEKIDREWEIYWNQLNWLPKTDHFVLLKPICSVFPKHINYSLLSLVYILTSAGKCLTTSTRWVYIHTSQ